MPDYYHTNPDRRCPDCALYGHDILHLRACVPQRYWPESVTTTDAGTDIVTVEATNACDCGYVAKNAAGLRLHRMKAKQHQVVPLPQGEFLPEGV